MEGGDVAFIRPGIFHTGCCYTCGVHVTHMNGWIRVCVSSAVAVDWDIPPVEWFVSCGSLLSVG